MKKIISILKKENPYREPVFLETHMSDPFPVNVVKTKNGIIADAFPVSMAERAFDEGVTASLKRCGIENG